MVSRQNWKLDTGWPIRSAVCGVYTVWGATHLFGIVPMSRVEESIGQSVIVWYALIFVGGLLGWFGVHYAPTRIWEYIGLGWLGLGLTMYGFFKLIAAPFTAETGMSALFSCGIGLGLLTAAVKLKRSLWS